jgi:hypothetical protein
VRIIVAWPVTPARTASVFRLVIVIVMVLLPVRLGVLLILTRVSSSHVVVQDLVKARIYSVDHNTFVGQVAVLLDKSVWKKVAPRQNKKSPLR